MDIKFNKVFGNIYEGVEVQCGNNHWVKLNDDDILAYPIMRDYLLRNNTTTIIIHTIL